MQCPHPITLKSGVSVPCGKCIICKANERQEWVFRLKEELKVNAFSIFVTLTYDDEHIPQGYNVSKRDVQLFLKRLRKKLPSRDFRYYIVSEYGDHTFRPHYHGLFFFNSVPQVPQIYDLITESWQKGFCKYGAVELASIVYCTKYCLKKSAQPEGREPVFRLMSRMNGGLGAAYIDTMGVWHTDSGQYNVAYADGKRCRMPAYYKRLLQHNNPSYSAQQEAAKEDYRKDALKRANREFMTKFANKYDSDYLACMAFNDCQSAKALRSENLILKHCKKQLF